MGDLGRRLRKLETSPHDLLTFSICEGSRWGEELPPDEYCEACGQTMRTHFTLDLGSAAVNPWPEGEDAEG